MSSFICVKDLKTLHHAFCPTHMNFVNDILGGVYMCFGM